MTLRDHPRSSVTMCFDTGRTILVLLIIVTIPISRTISEIQRLIRVIFRLSCIWGARQGCIPSEFRSNDYCWEN